MTKPVVQFLAAGVAVMAVLGVGVAVYLHRAYQDEGVRDAKTVVVAAVRGPIGSVVTDRLVQGDPAEVARVDAVVRHEVLGPDVLAVKLWTQDGRNDYSTDPGQIGMRDTLDRPDTEPFRDGKVAAHFSGLAEQSDAPERSLHVSLVEAYQLVRTPTGTPLLLESYVEFSRVRNSTSAILVSSIPALVGALILLELLQVPLAVSLARRVQRAERGREEFLQEALELSDAERRRIAGDLHDGVVQDLTGLHYGLTEAAEHADASGDTALATHLRESAGNTRRSIQGLRTLFVEIYPPNLHQAGLSSALSDLVASAAASGTHVTVDVAPDLTLTQTAEALIYRTAREAVRNTSRHAGALNLSISVARVGDEVVLEVVDDGRGFVLDDRAQSNSDGHLGLRLLMDLAAQVDGKLIIDSQPEAGTRVRLEVPA